VLNRCEDVVELREEPFEVTLGRGERYAAVTSAPPTLVVPAGLAAPAFATGAGADGLACCRALLDRFDDVVAPGGAAHLVASLLGTEREPFFADELRRRAEQQRLCIDVFLDVHTPWNDAGFAALGAFFHRADAGTSLQDCTGRVARAYRELGATWNHLAVITVRRSAAVAPSCRVFDRR
jgi:hypothetical protein